jgi:hypothetical protein
VNLQSYIEKRRQEIREQVHPDFLQIIDSGFDLIEYKLVAAYGNLIGPQIARKVELLEVLLFSFINHCNRPEDLDEMEEYLSEIGLSKSGNNGNIH